MLPTLISIAIFLSLAMFIVSFLFLYQRKLIQNRMEKKAMEETFERELERTKAEISEATFSHIGREIHDNIGQTLSVAKLYLASLPQEGSTEFQKKIMETKDLVGKAITDLRALSKSLNSETMFANGFENALQEELRRLKMAGNIETNFSAEGEPRPLDPNTCTMLFRMCQEIISNALKHAQAKHIRLDAKWQPDSFLILVQDDGKGFKPESLLSQGQGLLNLKKRAELIGAKLKIDSQPGKGTSVSILLPQNQE